MIDRFFGDMSDRLGRWRVRRPLDPVRRGPVFEDPELLLPAAFYAVVDVVGRLRHATEHRRSSVTRRRRPLSPSRLGRRHFDRSRRLPNVEVPAADGNSRPRSAVATKGRVATVQRRTRPGRWSVSRVQRLHLDSSSGSALESCDEYVSFWCCFRRLIRLSSTVQRPLIMTSCTATTTHNVEYQLM